MLAPLDESRLAEELRMVSLIVARLSTSIRKTPIVFYPQYSHEPRFSPSSLPDRVNAAAYVQRLRKRLHDGDIQSLDCRDTMWPLLEMTYSYLSEFEIIDYDGQRALLLPLFKSQSYWSIPECAGYWAQKHVVNAALCFESAANSLEHRHDPKLIEELCQNWMSAGVISASSSEPSCEMPKADWDGAPDGWKVGEPFAASYEHSSDYYRDVWLYRQRFENNESDEDIAKRLLRSKTAVMASWNRSISRTSLIDRTEKIQRHLRWQKITKLRGRRARKRRCG